MAYRVIHAGRSAQQIRKLDRQIARRVTSRIDDLAGDPRPQGSKRLEGHRDLYRVRVGDNRIIYRINDARQLVEITVVAHRSEVYRSL